jgi:hypothetical protein
MASWTFTLEVTRGVDASATSTQGRVTLAFIDIHADLHHRHHLKARVTVAGETALNVDTGAIATHTTHDFTLININTFYTIFVQSISLVAPTTEGTNRVFAPAIYTHVGESQTFIDVNLLNKSISFAAQLVKIFSACSRALCALVSPGLTKGTTARFPFIQAIQASGADAQSVVQIAGLLS